MVMLMRGHLVYDVNLSVGSVLLGSLLAILVAKVLEFFRFCVDYSRTEKVQFEDDEYYYYVKAVPKMTVSVPTKTVKKINSQRGRALEAEARASRQPGRSVETQRTARSGSRAAAHSQNLGAARKGRMTVGSAESQGDPDDDFVDYEE